MEQPFATEEFFAGGLHALNYLIDTARNTKGSKVWFELFSTMRTNLLVDAAQKGFTFK